ncbi:MAG: ATP-binding protein [Actinomycetota bacterium]
MTITKRIFAAIGILTVFTIFTQLKVGGSYMIAVIGNLCLLGGAVASAAFLWAASRRAPKGQVRALRLLVAGLTLWAAAQVAWTTFSVLRATAPFPSMADAAFLGAYLLFIAGILTFGVGQRRSWTLSTTIDAAIIAACTFLFSWTFLLQSLVEEASRDLLGKSVAFAYPALASMLIAVIIIVSFHNKSTSRGTLGAVCGAFLVLGVTDSLYALVQLKGSYHTGNIIDSGWIAWFLILWIAAGFKGSDNDVVTDRLHSTRWNLYSPLLMVLAIVGLTVVKFAITREIDVTSGLVALGILLFAIGRQFQMIHGYLVLQENLSHQALQQEALNAKLEVSRRLESLGQLAGGVAHDFNNLLAVIINYAEFLRESFSPGDERIADIEQIQKAADQAADLTQRLMVFGRKSGSVSETLDLNLAIETMHLLIGKTLGEQIELEMLLDPNLSAVCSDSTDVEQILLNLTLNSRDGMPRGGRLTITTAQVSFDEESVPTLVPSAGSYALLTLSDNGVGMDPECVEKAFEPFFTTKPTGEGTGLGLSSVYGIVKHAGGSVHLYSEPDKGTTVRIYLPTSEEPSSIKDLDPRTSEPSKKVWERGGEESILVVEDQEAVRAVTAKILASKGYRVIQVDGPDDALVLLNDRAIEVDLLLTDVIMPGISGPDLVGFARTMRPGLRVLLMSGYTGDSIFRRFEENNIDYLLLEKPFTKRELLERVRTVLDEEPLDLSSKLEGRIA